MNQNQRWNWDKVCHRRLHLIHYVINTQQMFSCKSYISKVTCSSVTYLVASKVKRQQFLILSCEVAKCRADALCPDISYTTVSQ